MNPEDIRRLYHRESAASAEEAAQTQEELLTDPDMARKYLLSLYALANEDRNFTTLLKVVTDAAVLELIRTQADADDTFALKLGELMVRAMGAMRPTPRGKKARSA